ncbi:MAG: LptA/OstA family protein [Alphaproteobacteria bacterium]|nr:LptA/OstA family protein [Alphaproteobacteria bacterium]
MLTSRLFKIKQHTRNVLIFKRSLPVAAFLLASLIFVWPALFAERQSVQLAVKKMGRTGSDMEQVRFYSNDDSNQPLSVTTPVVMETDPQKQIVTLETPEALYKMSNGVSLTSWTSYALAFQQDKYLYFEDAVVSSTDTGYMALSSQVIYDYTKNMLHSDAPVHIDGPDGRLDAEGFVIYDKGDHIDFKGKSDIWIVSQKEPLHIQSDDGVRIHQSSQTIAAAGDVCVRQAAGRIASDKMTLFYYTKQQNPTSRIQKIVAEGRVAAETPAQKMTGDRGEYNPETSLVTMTGDVVLSQGNSVAYADTATLNLKTGVSSLTPDAQRDAGKRITGTLVPAELKGKDDR